MALMRVFEAKWPIEKFASALEELPCCHGKLLKNKSDAFRLVLDLVGGKIQSQFDETETEFLKAEI